MKVLFVLSHPGHYYLFKYVYSNLKKNSHEVEFAIRDKDILESILISEGMPYTKLAKEYERGNSSLSILAVGIWEMLVQDFNLFKKARKFNPDVMVGTDISISHIGKILNIPSLVFNEDDYEINKLFCKATYPFATKIISPMGCSVGKYGSKKIEYDGYQKIAYLHPKYFVPDNQVLKKLKLDRERYFIIRVVNLKAIHDIEGKHSGISIDVLEKIIKKLEKKGKVFINSEGDSLKEFESYFLDIEPNEMHSVLAYSDLFIGDSQTMAAEAGLVGTPFIRFNDFVGKISYLNDIENKYKLGFGVKTENIDKLFDLIDSILSNGSVKEEWINKRNIFFNDKINVTDFWTWLIENYPQSTETIKEDPDFQLKFK
jgi:uncharacterized protein